MGQGSGAERISLSEGNYREIKIADVSPKLLLRNQCRALKHADAISMFQYISPFGFAESAERC